MHTHNINVAASESSKTWVNGEQGLNICVSANDLRTRWHTLEGENATPAEGKHFPTRNGSYGADVLLLDEAEVMALLDAGHKALPCIASSAYGMTALYDAGEPSTERYIIASRGQIFHRTNSWPEAHKKYLRRAAQVRHEEVQKFLSSFDEACAAGLDVYQASDVARGFISLESALNPAAKDQGSPCAGESTLNEIPF